MRASLVAAIALAAACGGAPARPTRANVAPDARGALPRIANRNAPPPAPADPGPGRAVALWCSQPGGSACGAAERALGQAPSPAEGLPGELMARARDGDDDCNDPELAPLMQRVTSAVGAGSRWRDESGGLDGLDAIGDPRRGGGCASLPAGADPFVRIHAADAPEGVRFLVRVWEVGDVDEFRSSTAGPKVARWR